MKIKLPDGTELKGSVKKLAKFWNRTGLTGKAGVQWTYTSIPGTDSTTIYNGQPTPYLGQSQGG